MILRYVAVLATVGTLAIPGRTRCPGSGSCGLRTTPLAMRCFSQ
jgi:hypothetical protein